MSKMNEIIGNNINTYIEKEITLKEASVLLNVSSTTIKRYIDGTSPISANNLWILADYLHVSVGWFYEDNHTKQFYTKQESRDFINYIAGIIEGQDS